MPNSKIFYRIKNRPNKIGIYSGDFNLGYHQGLFFTDDIHFHPTVI